MRVVVALPLAVLAAIATLFCSGYILGETGWSKASRVSVRTLPMSPDSPHPTSPKGHMLDAAAAAALATPEDADPDAVALSASAPPPPSPPVVGCKLQTELPLVGAAFAESAYGGHFLVARRVTGRSPDQIRALLKTMLGLATLLGRTLVLPYELCACSIPADGSPGTCTGDGAAPFDCPLTVPLDPTAWTSAAASSSIGGWELGGVGAAGFQMPKVIPARFLTGKLPAEFVRSHVRVLLPDGLDGEVFRPTSAVSDSMSALQPCPPV